MIETYGLPGAMLQVVIAIRYDKGCQDVRRDLQFEDPYC
jgi:hypothetical protein